MMSFFQFAVLVFIGFANALPIPLSGTVLSVWLSELGFEKSAIGFYAFLSLPFSFKLIWSPIVDRVAPPLFPKSPRKGWMAFSLLGMALSLGAIGLIDLSQTPFGLGVALLTLSTFSGCLYMVGLSYEIESLEESSYSLGSASVVAGYRIGLLCAGGGGLALAYFWDWSSMYLTMAALVASGAVLILLMPEPQKSKGALESKRPIWQEMLMRPCQIFFKRSDALAILVVVFGFKCGDQLSKTMEGPFYLSLGFNKADLALAAKMWGFGFTILGAFISGFWIKGKNPFFAVGIMGCLHASTLICLSLLAYLGKSYVALYATVALENLTGGMAMAAFVAFLWHICDRTHAAAQYALLWSFFSLKGDILAFLGGILATFCPWPLFFSISALLGLLSSAWVLMGSAATVHKFIPNFKN